MQSVAVSAPERAYMAAFRPTLHAVAEQYGQAAATAWTEAQITALFCASASRDTRMVETIRPSAAAFAAEAAPYSLPELLLFFGRYRAGRYDSSFSAFDARRIGTAFRTEFLPHRALELAAIERRELRERRERAEFTPPDGYTSLSWYEHLKRRAAAGDAEAKAALRPPKEARHATESP